VAQALLPVRALPGAPPFAFKGGADLVAQGGSPGKRLRGAWSFRSAGLQPGILGLASNEIEAP
jgi:hypothetical protein